MELGTKEIKRILAGDHSSLKFTERPELEIGSRIVVLQSKEERVPIGCPVCKHSMHHRCAKHPDGDPQIGDTITVPPQDVFWIEVSHRPFLRDGKWVVRFHVHDRRDDPRYLAPGGGYTSSPHLSSDKDQGSALRAVDDETLDRFARENRERWDEGRDTEAEKARRYLNTLAKIQREAAKLGVSITPEFETAVDSARAKIVRHRRAA